MSMTTDSGNNPLASLSTLDGISLRQGGEAPYYLHRSSTLPHLRKKSNSLPEVESLYSNSKPRSPNVGSSSLSTGSPTFLKSPKPGSPLSRQLEGDVDITDCFQLVGSQHLSSQIQHHQLHHSSLGSSSKRPETDIAELSESPGRVKPPLKSSLSVPLFILRKENYSEAICNGEEGGEVLEGGQSGGIAFSAPSDTSSTTTAKTHSQLPNENRQSQSLKMSSYRAASNGLEAIKEERASLSGSGSSDVSSQGDSRAGSSSPAADKPKVKSRSQSPRGVTVKGTPARNHRAISSDV